MENGVRLVDGSEEGIGLSTDELELSFREGALSEGLIDVEVPESDLSCVLEDEWSLSY